MKTLTVKLKEAENRAENAEKSVKRLQKEVDRLEGMYRDHSIRIWLYHWCQNAERYYAAVYIIVRYSLCTKRYIECTELNIPPDNTRSRQFENNNIFMIPFCPMCFGCYLQSTITRDDESHTILLRTQFFANAFPQIVYSTRRRSTRQSATTWTRLSPNSPDTKRWRHRSVSMCRPTIKKSTTIHTKHDAYHTHSIHTTPVSRLSTTSTTLCSNYCSKNDTRNTHIIPSDRFVCAYKWDSRNFRYLYLFFSHSVPVSLRYHFIVYVSRERWWGVWRCWPTFSLHSHCSHSISLALAS